MQQHAWWAPIACGSVAGAVGYVGTMPLDYVKQRLQTDRQISLQSLRANGWKTLFRGGLVGCSSIVPQMTIKFTVNDYLRRTTHSSAYLNGFVAGFVDGSFLGPLFALQSMKQMRNDVSYGAAFKRLRLSNPLRLALPMALRNAVFTSIMFGGHNAANANSESAATFGRNLLVGSILNVPATIAASPFDVLRAKQIQFLLEGKPTGPFLIARTLFSQGGVRAFYQGYGSLYVNFALRFPFTFALFRLLIEL
jgi:hypothetical protein